MNNIYNEEIEYRDSLLEKACSGIKLSSEERLWLATHAVHNTRYGDGFFNVTVDHFEPNKWNNVKLTIESVNYTKKIMPIIYLPDKKGKIIAECEVFDYYGNVSKKKFVRMLALETTNDVYYLKCFSEQGIFSIGYKCDYYDEKMKLNIRESSFTGSLNFAMKRETVNDQCIRYYCKAPFSENFDALVFSVEWGMTR